jgi:probable DNA metabolism protein
MQTWSYDHSFEGFLTLVFDCFEHKLFPEKILRSSLQQPYLFPSEYTVVADEQKARRVWTGLHKRISATSCQMLYYAFLSEENSIENKLLSYIRKAFELKRNNEYNFGDETVLAISKISTKVSHEANRIKMFVRFQKTGDDMYFASFDPQYNVLPLVTEHFENRFADQQWIIYDTRRNYGFYYNLNKTSEINFIESPANRENGAINAEAMAADEQEFQNLWKNYFSNLCIKERINPKLHVKLLPKRYWKYLIEKQK